MKLVVFGDSYASKLKRNGTLIEPVWYELLAKQLEIDLLHFGQNGTAIEYSIAKLYEYINSKDYSENDIIIFVCTSLNRLPLVHSDIPPGVAAHWLRFLDGSLNQLEFLNFFKKHSDFYKTLFNFFNYDTAHRQKTHAAFLLKGLPNKTIIISAFEDVDEALNHNQKKLLKTTANFILINASLSTISAEEYGEGVTYESLYNFFGGEIRNAHLSKSNNIILANQLYKCIVRWDNKFFNRNKFKKNFIKLVINEETAALYDKELLPVWRENFG